MRALSLDGRIRRRIGMRGRGHGQRVDVVLVFVLFLLLIC